MRGRIHIRDLSVRCIIGIYPHERREKQDVIINVTLEGDFGKAVRSDDIADAINYKDVKKRIIALVEESKFNLILNIFNVEGSTIWTATQ